MHRMIVQAGGLLTLVWLFAQFGCSRKSPYDTGWQLGQHHAHQLHQGTLEFDTWIRELEAARQTYAPPERTRFMEGYDRAVKPARELLSKMVAREAGRIAGEVAGQVAVAVGEGLGEMMKHMGQGLGDMLARLEEGTDRLMEDVERAHRDRRTARTSARNSVRAPGRDDKIGTDRREDSLACGCDDLKKREQQLQIRTERLLAVEAQLRAREARLLAQESAF